MENSIAYPIAETFYSIIGEGDWVGTPAFFIRLAGCNLNCPFCDTEYGIGFSMTPAELYELAKEHPTKKVVITGGEPTIHTLRPLTDTLRGEFKLHLETNGVKRPDSFDFDWIAVSPKKIGNDETTKLVSYASEVKFLCGIPNWEEILKYYLPVAKGHKFLMPLACGSRLVAKHMDTAVQYCLKNPQLRLCLQIHKIGGFK